MENISLRNFIDTKILAQMQTMFHKASGFSVYTVEKDSTIVPITGQSEFCSLLKKSSAAQTKCASCINSAKEQAFRTCHTAMSTCFSGMIEVAVPFVIGNTCMGAMIIGEVFTEKPNETTIKNLSREYGIDEKQLSAAANKVVVTTKAKAQAIADLMFSMTGIFLDMGKQCNDANEKSEKLRSEAGKIKLSIDEAETYLSESEKVFEMLRSQFTILNELSENATKQLEDTSETVKGIQDIALNTRILGFNASIEASRAKESGKGFGVIAQEVRSLADVSKTSAERIEEIIQSINETNKLIRKTILDTGDKAKENYQNLSKMSNLLEQMKELSQDL